MRVSESKIKKSLVFFIFFLRVVFCWVFSSGNSVGTEVQGQVPSGRI
jgi:hypothetical protein